jgi:septin 4
MRKLHKKVNLVPVIGKADSLTTAELSRFKSQVLQELKQYEIQVCLFSQSNKEL